MTLLSRKHMVAYGVLLCAPLARCESVTTTALQLYGLGRLRCAAYSPMGGYILTGGAAGAFLWEIQNGRLVRAFIGHAGVVTSVAFSPEGSRVLTGSEDGTLKLWSVTDATLLRTYTGHTVKVNSVAFSPDGTRVLAGSDDTTAKQWNITNGALIHTFKHDNYYAVQSVAYTPDGAKVVTAGGYNLKIWNAANGSLIRTIPTSISSIPSVTVSPDGNRVAAGMYYGAKIWDINTGALYRTFDYQSDVKAVAFSFDGTKLLTGNSNGTMRMWDIATTGLLRTFSGHTADVVSVAFSPDGTKALTASLDDTARLWSTATGAAACMVTGHTKAVYNAAFTPDESQVLTGCSDGTVKVWNATSGTVAVTMPVSPGAAESAAFSPDGASVAMGVGSFSGINLWRILDGALLRSFTPSFWAANAICFSPNGARILAGGGFPSRVAELWDVASGTRLKTFSGHAGDVRAVAFSANATRVLTGSADSTAKLYDAASTPVLRTFSGHAGGVNSVTFSPDGTKVLTGSDDKTARLWNTSNAALIRTFYHASGVNAVAFSPDGARILTGCADGTIEVWDVSNAWSPLHIFAGHTGPVFSVRFSADGKRVLSASADGTARLWIASNAPALDPDPLVVSGKNKFILIAGGGNYAGNSIISQTQALADQAFFTALARGYSPADIYYLSAFDDWRTRDSNSDGSADADAQATKVALWSSIDSWAFDAGRLFLYFVNHGSYNPQTGEWSLRLNASEYITATELDSHLDALQSKTGCEVILILDCCYAGGFVQRCKAPAGRRRLIFASTTSSHYSIFTPPKATDSFSSFFFSFAILGNSLADVFDWTKTIFGSMKNPAGQDPCADADGDGDWDKWDRSIARSYVLGNRPAYGLNAPTILSVAPTQTITAGRSATLWARLDAAVAAKEVWAVILPPEIPCEPGQPVTSLTRVNLSYLPAVSRWQAVWTPGPAHRGRCKVVYYAFSEDALKTRLLATPRISELRVFATSVHLPWQLLE